jgi:hypothetical protein
MNNENIKNFVSNLYITNKIPILIILLGIFSALMLFNTYNSYGKTYVSKIIKDLVDVEVVRIQQEYSKEVEKRDVQIEQLTKLVLESDEVINNLKKRLSNVEYKIKNRQIPKTSDELRVRLGQLGYSPVN